MTILYAIFPLLALLFIASWVRRWKQTADRAYDRVLKALAQPRPPEDLPRVIVWQAYPLSEHMIKDIAASKGFRHHGDSRAFNGGPTLTFEPPKPRTRKLPSHD